MSWNDPWMLLGLFPLMGYAIGSTPVGVIIARAKGVNLRAHGSGNVGATNVGRVLGARWGYLCFALDVAKGFAPAMATGMVLRPPGGALPGELEQAAWLAVSLAAILGHVFSFWLRFRGGKGVATGLGVVLGVWPYFTAPGLAALGLWIVVTLLSRYVSLGSIVAALAFGPLFVAYNWLVRGAEAVLALWPLGAFAVAVGLLIVLRHRSNIARLLAGTENKIGAEKAKAGTPAAES